MLVSLDMRKGRSIMFKPALLALGVATTLALGVLSPGSASAQPYGGWGPPPPPPPGWGPPPPPPPRWGPPPPAWGPPPPQAWYPAPPPRCRPVYRQVWVYGPYGGGWETVKTGTRCYPPRPYW